MLTLRDCIPGDIDSIRTDESSPFDGWASFMENNAGSIKVALLDGQPVAVFGFVEIWPGTADSVAIIDRAGAAGNGMELAIMIRGCADSWMAQHGIHRAQAICDPADKAAPAFLRAIGYRKESVMRKAASNRGDLHLYTLHEG